MSSKSKKNQFDSGRAQKKLEKSFKQMEAKRAKRALEKARREAERGTFDPTYLVYSLGKLMMLKLRRDYKEQQGGSYSLRSFHDAVLSQGSAPFWAHRRLLLDETVDRSLE